MVDMLLLQVGGAASTPVCCSSALPAHCLQQAACTYLAPLLPSVYLHNSGRVGSDS
jgi:hypothetical protein